MNRHWRLFCCLVSVILTASLVHAVQVCTVSDIVYRGDGTAAQGTLVISWPAFTSAEAISSRDIVDEEKFRDGLSKIIDGVVQCLNASTWAKAR
jgi:hypothetical protein